RRPLGNVTHILPVFAHDFVRGTWIPHDFGGGHTPIEIRDCARREYERPECTLPEASTNVVAHARSAANLRCGPRSIDRVENGRGVGRTHAANVETRARALGP